MKRACVAVILSQACPAWADDQVEAFYRASTISLYVGTANGNDYAYRAELLARHLKRHIPGQPNIVVRYMPGAGGIVAANMLANVAPRDGTSLLASMQNMATLQAVGSAGVRFDTRRFNWIGSTSDSANVLTMWHTSGVRSIADAKSREVLMGGVMGNAGLYYLTALNALVGTKVKPITGYDGGNAVNLAMERGEVSGRNNSIASWKATKPDWLSGGKISFIVQIALKKDADYPDVPLLTDLASNSFDRDLLRFISADTAMARPVAMSPDAPPERVAAMRQAFEDTMRDPQFLAEAEAAKFDIAVARGSDVGAIVRDIVEASPTVIERARRFINGG